MNEIVKVGRQIPNFEMETYDPEEACPANWTEGEKTLKPGGDLVGRVGEVLAKN